MITLAKPYVWVFIFIHLWQQFSFIGKEYHPLIFTFLAITISYYIYICSPKVGGPYEKSSTTK